MRKKITEKVAKLDRHAQQQTEYIPKVSMARGEGFWISPCGEAIVVQATHIMTIDGNPEKFGMTREQLDAWYARYGESRSQEGNAREEIIKALVRRGWIRVRLYTKRSHNGFTVNVGSDDLRVSQLVTSFFQKLMKRNPDLKYYEICYDMPLDKKRFTVIELVRYALLKDMNEGVDESVEVIFLQSPEELTSVPL